MLLEQEFQPEPIKIYSVVKMHLRAHHCQLNYLIADLMIQLEQSYLLSREILRLALPRRLGTQSFKQFCQLEERF